MTVTARVEVELNLTIMEGSIVRAAAAFLNATPRTLDYAELFLDGLRLAMNANAGAASWRVYRGGSHVALIKDGERILFAVEDRPVVDSRVDRVQALIAVLPRESGMYAAAYAEAIDRVGLDEAAVSVLREGRHYGLGVEARIDIRRRTLVAYYGPQVKPDPAQTETAPVAPNAALQAMITAGKAHADDAPTVAPSIAAGDEVDVFVNQAKREGWVLAVLGDEYILEYTMPKGTTALQIRKVDGGTIMDGKYRGSYRNVSYAKVPTRWLQAIVDAGSVWEGRAQGVYVAATRYSPSNHKAVATPRELLAAKGKKTDVCEHGYAQGCRACNPDGGR